MANRRFPLVVGIRVTYAERSLLDIAARLAGQSRAAFVRAVLLREVQRSVAGADDGSTVPAQVAEA